MSDQRAISTEGVLPDFSHVQQLVADAMVRTDPDTPAIRAFGQQVTYRQLDEQSDMLSQAILRVAPDAERIGISCTRTVEMVISVLAILKAGKAYLPLDPAYPEARLQQLITDSQVQVCLATAVDAVLFTTLGLQVLRSDEPQAGPVRPVTQQSETACVLYTSGSTGKPKGVCLTHRGLVNMLTNQVRRWIDQPGLQTLQFCHLSFDASFPEIFVPLLTGGTVHLIDDSYRLNAGRLLDYIEQETISRVFLPYVVLQYLTEAAVADGRFPTRLQEIITGGELLKITPAIARFFDALPDCTLMNVYGPTEASVWVTENRLRGAAQSWPQLPSIGRVVPGCEVVIVDEQLTVVPDGEVGEIGICGVCLADGYLNQPERTADAFVDWQHPRLGPTKLYRTGDLARLMPDGTFDFHGRRDTQVKIRGNRVELGEIEVLLAQQPAVQQAVVVAREDIPGHKRLVAYVVASPADFSVPALRAVLAERLPDFMLPTYYVRLDDLPRTTSGKVDKAQLPPPDHGRPDLTTLYRPARTALEKQIVGLWEEWLQLDPVGCDDNFFELGGNSLLAQQTVAALEQRGFTVPITKLYQHPTAAGLAAFIQPAANVRTQQTTPEPTSRRPATADDAIAVIGMSGRFPGASTIDELWTVLTEGRETTRFFTEAELDASIPATLRTDPGYVKARGVIDGADQFDARFFGLTPAIAQVMDPQQRIFLEIAYEALESTGHLPDLYGGRVGVFAGCGNNTYYLNNVLPNSAVVAQVGSFQAMTVNEKDYIASRTAYQLNLNGPAVSVYSACSTSLLAIAQAVQSLRSGQCEVALAGGASITAPVNSGHLYQEGAMFSRDGHTRSFNADSTGTVFSDGAGVVLLKRLDDAQRDGDTIYAVIKGVGVNNDGGNKGSFTAPNADGQAGSIRMALADAQVDPATIRYVEAHGTATPVGDPIEIEGLTAAFGPQTRQQYCAIGSIKSNMGHLTQAAGVAGVIKTVLSLYHRQLPASINFEKPNPTIDFANSPFYVNATLRDWVQDEPGLPRRAGVSSFGVGGTNVHVVLEEAAVCSRETMADAPDTATPARPVQLLTWSAKSVQSRDTYGAQLAHQLRQPNAPALTDTAFTLQTTRPNYSHRRFAVATTPDDFSGAVSSAANARTLSRVPGDVVFLFPGQGAQFLNMGRALYEHEPTFRQAIDECAGHLQPHLGADIRHVLYPDTVSSEAEQQLRNTLYTQAALFVTEYALARLWMSWGIEPSILCGHSVGEFVAAHLAGVFTLPDVLRLVAARGRLVSEQPRGSMLSVRVGIETLQLLVPDTLSVAAINSRHLCVVAGLDEDIADFARLLDEQEIPNRPLATSHAFHSAMMDPVVTRFADIVKIIPLSRPQRPVVSTVTGAFLTDAQATDPGYWATHLRATVRFADALDTVFGLDEPLLLEVGPGRTVATLARQQATDQPMTALAGLATQADAKTTYESVLTTLGQLYLHGLPINWQAFYADQAMHRVSLPTYAFDRRRCWVDAPIPATVTTSTNDRSISTQPTDTPIATPPMRTTALIDKIYQLLEDASGIEMAGTSPDTNFLELGFDSLLLTQMAITLRNEFGTPITFRQLTADMDSPKALATFLDQQLPAEQYQPTPAAAPVAQPISQPVPVAATPVAAPVAMPMMPPPAPVPMMAAPAMGPVAMPGGDSALGLIAQQLQLLARQVALMQGVAPQPAAVQPAPVPPVAQPAPTIPAPQPAPGAAAMVAPAPAKPVTVSMPTGGTGDLTPEEQIEHKKPFGATAKIDKHSHELTTVQRQFLDRLTKQYNQKTAGSKAYAQQHRSQMADPRVVSGFRPVTKEIVYPIVVNRSAGSRLWDVDGNEYIDVLNGFGSNMFGYQPDFVKQALHEQIEKGFEVGPQHELAGEVSQLVCELTGSERVALCNTGSEAVLGAMRVARTITGRSLIVAFAGSYHGIVDEVLVRGSKKLKTFPAASGIMANVVQNMLILDYGTDESLRIIRERADELAAVLVEPIQSRRPEFVPIEFLKELRSITAASGSALIFDEVITGFRMHLGGAQALLGIRADMATYGKVAGAGMSIGIIGGKRSFMDALDGGFWQYGDASAPEVGVTYFAGTFVRHPLALAAAKASMLHLREQGTGLQQALTRKTTYLADTLNAYLTERQLPMFIAHFGSLWKLKYTDDMPYSELLFTLLRQKGIHVWDGFPCFMTEAHTDEEIDTVITAFCQSIDAMIEATFFPGKAGNSQPAVHEGVTAYSSEPPVAGARLGRDPAGNPAWFLPDPNRPGAYLQVDLTI